MLRPDAWLVHERQPASPAITAQEIYDQDLFFSRPCAFCHAVRGTPAHGVVAPDLTYLAIRRGLAANTIKNNQANLAAWVTHAQVLKPEVSMPNVTQFKGDELRALVAYLSHLR
jgi:cytochrome c oxidase subunit 2